MIAKVQPGQRFRFPAEAYNAFVDAAAAHRGSRFDRGGDEDLGELDASSVTVMNDSGSLRRAGHIVGLGAPRLEATANPDLFRASPCLAGALPTRSAHQYGFGILLDPLDEKQVGRARVSGLAVCQVDVRALIHPRATIKDNDPTQLESDFWGCAEILTPRTATGTQWCLVRMGAFGGQKVRGKIAAAIDEGAAGTVNVWTGKGSAAAVSSPLVTITDAFNPFADLTSTSVFVHVVWANDGPEIDAAGCA